MAKLMNCILPQTQFADLAQLLPKVATDDRTVIITSVNEAFARPNSLLGLFRESFQVGEGIGHLLNNVLVVAVDAKAYERCQLVHQLCYYFRVDGVDYAAEQSYMQKDYLDMMWRRNRFQARILELGYSFVFTVSTEHWCRGPSETTEQQQLRSELKDLLQN